MITNFSEITSELTPDEKALIKVLIAGFETKIGKHNAIKSVTICERINMVKGLKKKVTGVRLRKMCNFIRSKGLLPLISTEQGYYISYDKNELAKQIKSLNERADAINNAANGLKRFITN